ncbi:MAG: hypothetical protein WC473_03610 [Patescibacteria group bacterium]|jgi:hypothetical protein
MKNKILTIVTIVATLTFAGQAYAANQGSNNGSDSQTQQQTQTTNQGEDSQIQVQNNEQAQSGNTTGINAEEPVQQRTQQQLRDESEAGGQIQNQNQIQAGGQEAVQSQSGMDSVITQQRRSQVANAVQELLQVSERNGGIGEQVRVIAQSQNQNRENLEASLEKVQNRSGLAKFFVGPDYGEINKAQKFLEQNREQIQQLNQIKDQFVNQGDQQMLIQQIQILEQADLEIGNYLGTAQKGFSLLGWMFRLFAR